jgi:tetratricopeptide (TPR) repeat protein
MSDDDGKFLDFFISYTKTDENWAEWIRDELEASGHTTILQASDFLGGSNFVVGIDSALRKTRTTIAVLSPEYLQSPWCTAEWAATLRRDPVGKDARLLPIRIADCDPAGLLGSVIYVDLVGLSRSHARRRLLAGLGLPQSRRDSSASTIYPGDVGPWSLPHDLNPNFFDREDLLAHLHQALHESRAPHCAVLGPPGVGKTQLAVSYAYKHAKDYSMVWWISANDLSSLRRDYTALAEALKLTVRPSDGLRDLLASVRHELEKRRTGWLLILDDASDVEFEFVWEAAPKTGGKLILTSRNQMWRDRAHALDVDVYSETDAVQFLLVRSGEVDEPSARSLANQLGRHPLALEQAGAYVSANKFVSLADYAGDFPQPDRAGTSLGDMGLSAANVASAFLPAFKEMKERSSEAADLLCLLSFLAPEDVPVPLLLEAGPALTRNIASVTRDVYALHAAVHELNRYSFLRGVTGDSMGVHELVQAVLRSDLDPVDRTRWGGTAVRLLATGFPPHSADPANWERCTRLLPHIEAVMRSPEAVAADPVTTTHLLNRAGGYLRHRSAFTAAEAFLLKGSELIEDTYALGIDRFVEALERLGLVLCNVGRFDDACGYLERALLMTRAMWGEDHERVVRLRERIAFEVLRPTGDLKGAKRMLEEVVRASHRLERREGLQLAHALSKLGFVCWDLRDLDRAKKVFERAIRIFSREYDEEHPEVARALTGLGQVLVDQGYTGDGRRCQERALDIFRRRLDPSDIEVAKTLDKLGYALREEGDPRRAIACHTEALEAYALIFRGDTHREIALALTNLGFAYGDAGDVTEARRHHGHALAIFRALQDERYEKVVMSRLAALPE